jgi:hypothetical protein
VENLLLILLRGDVHDGVCYDVGDSESLSQTDRRHVTDRQRHPIGGDVLTQVTEPTEPL